MQPEIIIIGSGIGGLCAGAILAKYGKKVLICESHTIPGGAAHSFIRDGFHFDSGPSFYCGLSAKNNSKNPLKEVLDLIEEKLEVIPYNPLGYYHFPQTVFPVYCNLKEYQKEISKITLQGAKELEKFYTRLLSLYDCLKDISLLKLRADWKLLPNLILNYSPTLLKALPQLKIINSSVGRVMD